MLDFVFRNTIKRLLAHEERKPKTIGILYNLLAPARRLRDRFVQLQGKINYDIQFSSQTLSLEQRLNEEYNLVSGSIYLQTVSATDDAVYTYWLSENQAPTYISWLSETTVTPVYTYWLNEPPSAGANLDFIVWVPSTLNFDQQRMEALIHLYKLAGKRFAIRLY